MKPRFPQRGFHYDCRVMNGHLVKVVYRYPTDHDLYFQCTRCKTRYAVAESCTKTVYHHESGCYDSRLHECPNCGTVNKGRFWMPGTIVPSGYANDW